MRIHRLVIPMRPYKPKGLQRDHERNVRQSGKDSAAEFSLKPDAPSIAGRVVCKYTLEAFHCGPTSPRNYNATTSTLSGEGSAAEVDHFSPLHQLRFVFHANSQSYHYNVAGQAEGIASRPQAKCSTERRFCSWIPSGSFARRRSKSLVQLRFSYIVPGRSLCPIGLRCAFEGWICSTPIDFLDSQIWLVLE